ncbi:MAG: OsmC family protein [Gemmatimonadota bacterium]|nr:OsmC family protein [Gemmatimonadota bacterium]
MSTDTVGSIVVRNRGGFQTEVAVGTHEFTADEPISFGGTDVGPTPYDYLVAAVGTCTAMTVRMYAARKKWPLEEVIIRLKHGRSHEADCENCETSKVGIATIERDIELVGALTDEQKTKLLAIADRCPVKQTLEGGLRVR